MPIMAIIMEKPLKHSSVWSGIDLCIPSLYCGAKYCRSDSKVTKS